MICLTEFNGKEVYLNTELIVKLEKSPDTIITLTTGKKIIVKEQPEEIVDKYIKLKRKIFCLREEGDE
ncbi:MAG: flagellar protein FlbD [Candidatus Muiribacterium halophilum]|uniref:Flagellar protein FlbD n=1 Tax=Muiribacterium halophilum TaxID=2053465 RepID=A0A2N5ZI92_MUIH1|nr:MAG: flagellar protein FlbD [Candidatus Muirbacterium halophilum]